MTIIDLKDIDEVFDNIKKAYETKPEEWKQMIVTQLTSNDGIDEFRNLAKIKALILNFVEENNIYHEEAIYQNDRVIENSYDFVANLVKLVGYKKDDDNE